MKRFKILSPLCLFVIAMACKNTQSNQNQQNSFEGIKGMTAVKVDAKSINNYLLNVDQVASDSRNQPKNFDQAHSKVYFIRLWNTPAYFVNGEWDGFHWDAKIFYGTRKDTLVYFPFEYRAYSEEFEKGSDSVFIVEKYMPFDALTTDPRLSVWWMAYLFNSERFAEFKNLDEFLAAAMAIDGKKEFSSYLEKVKKEVSKENGSTWRAKVLTYTKKVIPGDPSTWNLYGSEHYFKGKNEMSDLMKKNSKQ